MRQYKVKFYKNSINSKEPVLDYINQLPIKTKAKIYSYIKLLLDNKGYLDRPYSKHIKGKIRELCIDFIDKASDNLKDIYNHPEIYE